MVLIYYKETKHDNAMNGNKIAKLSTRTVVKEDYGGV